MYKGSILTFENAGKLRSEGSLKSLSTLFDFYLYGDKNEKERASYNLRKARNRKGVHILLTQRLSSCEEENEKLSLLRLGVSLKREIFIEDYLTALYQFKGKTNATDNQIYASITKAPLTNTEKQHMQSHILKCNNFSPLLLNACADYDTQNFLDKALDNAINKTPNKGLISFLSSNLDYLDLLQDIIRSKIVLDANLLDSYGKYLNPSIHQNQEVFNQFNSCIRIYPSIRDNVWNPIDPTGQKYPLSGAVCIVQHKKLSDENRQYLQQEITSAINSIDDLDSDPSKKIRRFLRDLAECDFSLAENSLITLYKATSLYSDKALTDLVLIKSKYAYREMSGVILTSEDRTRRFRYTTQLLLNFPEKAEMILNLAKDLEDARLEEKITEFINQNSLELNISDSGVPLQNPSSLQYDVSIIDHDTIISDLLLNLCRKISATTLYSAVGFVFKSGIKLLEPVFNLIHNNNGQTELIIGSLQTAGTAAKQTKIDRDSILSLKNLCLKYDEIRLFTFRESFFHGKFYYLGNGKEAYVITGSSNISKTAYLENYEFNTLIHIPDVSNSDVFMDWYTSFRDKCSFIQHLEESEFTDLQWESELDAFSIPTVDKLSISDIQKQISELSDEDTKFRLNIWMSHNPSEIYSNLGIPSLNDYMVFLFHENSLAVFESFIPGNAYYTFRFNDLENLLSQVNGMTKTQMLTLSSFLHRGYHIQNQDKLTDRIEKLFIIE